VRARLSAAIATGLVLAVAPSAHAATGFDWERAWGKNVVAGASSGFEVCPVAASCQAGLTGGLGGEMDLPHGVAADVAGNVYVADRENHRIQKFKPDGTWERAWGKDVVDGGGTGFEVCTVAADCKPGLPNGGLGGELSFPRDVATDSAGFVYVADPGLGASFNKRIQKFNSVGGFIRAWGKNVVAGGGSGLEVCTVAADCLQGFTGGQGGEMFSPRGIATDAAGFVYVADSDTTGTGLDNNRVQKFTSLGGFVRAWGRDVAAGGGDGFEVCTVATSCQAGLSGGLGGEMNSPAGVATDVAGNVYVADTENSRIQRFTSTGGWQRAWGGDVRIGSGFGYEICTVAADCKPGFGIGGSAGGMGFVNGVATDAAGDVYVADPSLLRIQVFTSLGGVRRAWGKDVVDGGGTGFEVCVAAASCKAGLNGGLGGEMDSPTGVAADAGGNVYVADRDNNRIQRFGATIPGSPSGGAAGGGGGPGAVPSNDFRFGKLKRKKKKGIAILIAFVPGPGEIGLRGPGIRPIGGGASASRITSGGRVKLKIRPHQKGKKAHKLRVRLRNKGKAKRKVKVTYTPSGGVPNTKKRKVKLVKK